MLRQYVSWINTPTPHPHGGSTGTETEKERRTKTKFQTCNLSNPQSCENDWGKKKGGGQEGKDGRRGVTKRANFKLI